MLNFLLSLVTALTTNVDAAVRVELKQGTFQGIETGLITGDGTLYSFKGIPYAAPPVGDLRFKAPQPAPSWEGINIGVEHEDECFQYDPSAKSKVEGSEDCLYLNVYSPPDLHPKEPYSVLIFVHGGAFKQGSGNSEDFSPDFLVPQGIILVTFNYRLGLLGFLSLENEEVPGNNALKDQVTAFRWVRDNIASFGGDPSKVTIMGQSAGSVAVSYHIVSPMSANLFQRAILMSGVFQCDFGSIDFPRKRAFKLGTLLGINTEDDTKLLGYLKSLNVKKFLNKTVKLTSWEAFVLMLKMITFSPTVEAVKGTEETFLPVKPEEYLNSGKINNVDVMIGYTSQESIISYMGFKDRYSDMNQYMDFFVNTRLQRIMIKAQQLEMGERIKTHYFGTNYISYATNKEIFDYLSMSAFKYPIQRFLRKLPVTEKSRYFYLFDAQTERNYEGLENRPDESIKGVCHADDLPYLFYQPSSNLTVHVHSRSFQIIQDVSKMWTNFVKTGNPTPDTVAGITWNPWTAENKDFLTIGTDAMVPGTFLDEDEYNFWDRMYEEILGNEPL